MVRHAVCLLLLCRWSTAVADSVLVHVNARLCLQGAKPVPDDSQLHLAPIGFIGAAPSMRRVAVRRGSADVSLPPAVWRASLHAPGLWAPVQDIVVSGDAEAVDVTLCARHLGRLTGSTSLTGYEGPLDTRAVITSSPDEPAPSPNARIVQEVFACAGSHQEWTCEVPSGRLDVEMRTIGFVPHYYWGLEIAPREAVRMPAIPLRRAASVSGEIHEQDGSPARHVAVALTPPDSSRPLDANAQGHPAVSAVTNVRGFFQLVGMPPGRYQVLARGRDGVEALVEVPVAANTESRLKQPLVLVAPAALTIRVTPERPPGGGGWTFTLRRTEFPAAQLVADARLDSRGAWRGGNLRPGPYRLELSVPSGRWLVRTIDVQRGDQLVEIDASPRRVGGSVRLGKSPVEGRIVWGGQFGAARVPLALGENGGFEGLIPASPADDVLWTVFVEGTRPPVARNVENVRLPSDPGEDIEIVLPGTSLRGTIVDADGKPVPLAIVYVSPEKKEPLEQRKNRDERGEFQFDGLPPGRYKVSAVAPTNLASDEVPVTLEEEGGEARVRLVLRRTADVVVRVRSPEGTPVPGARVLALPAQAPNAGAPVEVSDLRGEVTAHVPAGTIEVLIGVGAAGYASRMSRLGVSQGGLALLELSRHGGTLSLKLGSPLGEEALPVLYHGGTALAFPALTSSTLVPGGGPSPDSLSWTLPMMEPGRYTACVVAPSKHTWMSDRSLRLGRAEGAPCVTGLVGAGSELILRLED